MPFTRKDGTLIFTSKQDVEDYYQPLLKAVASKFGTDYPNGTSKYDHVLREQGNLYADKYKAESAFESNKLMDTYYLNAIETAESREELDNLANAYGKILWTRRDIIEKAKRKADETWFNSRDRLNQ